MSIIDPDFYIKNLIGKKFGKLTIVGYDHTLRSGKHTYHFVKCECECGNRVVKRLDNLMKNPTASCGCYRHELALHRDRSKINHEALYKGPTDPDRYLGVRLGKLTGTNEWRRRIMTVKGCDTPIIEYKFKCDCGGEIWYNTTQANKRISNKDNFTYSCGCIVNEEIKRTSKLRNESTHHQSKTRLYKIWIAMIDKCYKEHGRSYRQYGARGIRICKDWYDTKDMDTSFRNFAQWAEDAGYYEYIIEHEYSKTYVDLKDLTKDFSPDNTVFTDRRLFEHSPTNNILLKVGKNTYTLAQLADKYKVYPALVMSQYNNKYSANLIVYNMMHQDDQIILDEKGVARDKDGFMRLIPNLHAEFIN